MTYTYFPKGVCSQKITVDIDENGIITDCAFVGGCNGNTQGVSRLVTGRKAEDVIDTLSGIRCGPRPTSCPDQLSKALKEALAK